jgi:hypothetical protein
VGGGGAAKVYHFSQKRAKDELLWFANHQVEFIFCCDSNFGMFEKDVDYAQYASQLRVQKGYPKAFSVQNAKNATDRVIRIQEELSDSGLNKGITLALQSATPAVLENVNRKNISFEYFSNLQRYFRNEMIETYTDIILCLPGETYKSFISGIDRIIKSGQYNRIQFINLSVLPNSQMANPDYIKKHGLETVRSKCINIHGHQNENTEINEIQELVIASTAMPKDDWVRTRVWSWMCSLLFFDKVLQIPLTLAAAIQDVPISHLIEAMSFNNSKYPLLTKITNFFWDGAVSIQQGGPEYHFSKEVLGIYWPFDEYCLIDAVSNNQLDSLYEECVQVLLSVLHLTSEDTLGSILLQATELNKCLMMTPSEKMKEIKIDYNILEYFRGVLAGKPCVLKEQKMQYFIIKENSWRDIEDWSRNVIWYGNKKAAYWWPVEENTI